VLAGCAVEFGSGFAEFFKIDGTFYFNAVEKFIAYCWWLAEVYCSWPIATLPMRINISRN